MASSTRGFTPETVLRQSREMSLYLTEERANIRIAITVSATP
jgi:hypothetical protein